MLHSFPGGKSVSVSMLCDIFLSHNPDSLSREEPHIQASVVTMCQISPLILAVKYLSDMNVASHLVVEPHKPDLTWFHSRGRKIIKL